MRVARTARIAWTLALWAAHAHAKEWHVAPGGSGNGDAATPFGSIQAALDAAQAGDVVSVQAGTYAESLKSVRAGTAAAPITLRRAPGGGEVWVQKSATLFTLSHPYLVIEGLGFDGMYGAFDLVKVESGATALVLRAVEVKRTTKDCVDMAAPADVLIEKSRIHHCLNAAGGQTDAHGIVGGPVKHLTVRETEIHTFSGDALQFDPGRQLPGWDDILVEGCELWTGPLPSAENGFAAGTVPGENAIDTKTNPAAPRAKLTVRRTRAHGFQNGLISNMAAFNLKENVDALLDGVTVHDSEIAFRTRGPGSNGGAWVTIENAVVHDVAKAVRYEDDIEKLSVLSSTFGGGVAAAFQAASAPATQADVRNLLVLGTALPAQATAASNLATGAASFVNAAAHDYHLAPGSPAIDQGETIASVSDDHDGTPRPQGAQYDVGAYEYCTGAACGSSGAGGAGAGGLGGAATGGASSGGASSGGASSGGASSGGTSAAGASSGGAAAASSGQSDSGDDGGCGCRIRDTSSAPASLAWLAFAGLGLRRRGFSSRRSPKG
ncbi:MAG: choice-of-anchor Q domain-containing protein [Polyangiaceae bacterium]